MKLKKIFKNIPIERIYGAKEVEISGVCSNSKLVSPGNLFIAKRGDKEDGHKYIPQAISSGCVAVVTDLYDPTLPIPQVVLDNINQAEGHIAASYYEFPTNDLFMVGITGTNGKTTISYMIKHLLDKLLGPSGLLGTIEYLIGRHRYQATHTTADASSNQKLLREMILQGCRSSVMEVSSHALHQNRIACIDFDVAIFTNLTPEHLDYHKTMEEYALQKSKLFQQLSPTNTKKNYKRAAIVNYDSPWKEVMTKECQVPIITYGLTPGADLVAEEVRLSPSGSLCILSWKGEKRRCQIPTVGRFNVYNALAAIATLLSQGFSLDRVLEALKGFRRVPGRLEPVPNKLGLSILIDYAHTEDALRSVLMTLSELKKKRIITVFGCGGNRDVTKRPMMAKAVEAFSDFCIITQDNSRDEAPEEIVCDIMRGFSSPDHFIIELDREQAIKKAIEMAEPGDILLIAGKGHERQQIFKDKTVAFDDKKIAEELCLHLVSPT